MTINASTPAIHEPADDLIDALIDLVEARIDDEPDLAHYVAETLAEGLGFDVALRPHRPRQRPPRPPTRPASRSSTAAHRWRS